MIKSDRNYGIDALRILLMLGIITLHVYGHGGVLSSASTPLTKGIAWLIEVIAYPAVNGFVLISGFVGYRNERYYPKPKNIFVLHLTVLFYSVILAVLAWVLCPNAVGIKDVVKSFLPLLSGQYWFFTAYYAMFLLSPVLNFVVDKAEKQMVVIGCFTFLLFSFFEIISGVFLLNNGYSFVWFSCIYMIGAFIKKYDVPNKVSTRLALLTMLCAILITWLPKAIFEIFSIDIIGFDRLSGMLISYCSPTIVCVALCWLCVFVKVRTNHKLNRVISWLSPSVFAVYLIHDNVQTRSLLILDRFRILTEYNPFVMFFIIEIAVFVIFAGSILIDKIREMIFRLLRVDTLSEKAEKTVKSIVNKAALRIK